MIDGIPHEDIIRAHNYACIAIDLYERAHTIRLHGPDKTAAWRCVSVVDSGLIDPNIPEVWLDIYPYGERMSTILQIKELGDVRKMHLCIWDTIEAMVANPEKWKQQVVKDG